MRIESVKHLRFQTSEMYQESECRKMRPNIILKGNVPNYKNLVQLRKQYLTHPIPFLILHLKFLALIAILGICLTYSLTYLSLLIHHVKNFFLEFIHRNASMIIPFQFPDSQYAPPPLSTRLST